MTRQVLREATAFELSSSGRGAIGGDSVAALAANFSHVQLFNPASSSVNLVIEKISVTAGAANALVDLRSLTSALTTLSNNISNKLFKASTPVGEIRTQQNASALGILITPLGATQEGLTEVFAGTLPFILPPSNGVLIVPQTANQAITVKFEWVEE